jgi:hypothetical protein
MPHSFYDGSQPYRALWIQVVTQAKEDLEDRPVGSIFYDHAMAFFVGTGHWAEARGVIADLLGMHPDDLFQSGQRWIAARRKRDGLPSEPPRPPLAASTSLPQSVVLPGSGVHGVSLPPRRGGWPTAAKARAAATDAAHVPLIQHKVGPNEERPKSGRRHWSDTPGAVNPFAAHSGRSRIG